MENSGQLVLLDINLENLIMLDVHKELYQSLLRFCSTKQATGQLNYCFLIKGQKFCGKTSIIKHFKTFQPIYYIEHYTNLNDILNASNNSNIFVIDNISKDTNEEELFHLINWCQSNKQKLILILEYNYEASLSDLSSRLKSIPNSVDINPSLEDTDIVKFAKGMFYNKGIRITPRALNKILSYSPRSYSQLVPFIKNIINKVIKYKLKLSTKEINKIINKVY
jgi:chromosomal replication initiation ATPase DnaA